MSFAVGASTDVGRGRPANEDAFLVDHDDRPLRRGRRHGRAPGRRGGQRHRHRDPPGRLRRPARPLDQAVDRRPTPPCSPRPSANLEMRGMGTTLTAVVLPDDHHVLLGHVGDSRAYLLRDGGVIQVTEDHSLVEQLVREGRLSPEEAADHPAAGHHHPGAGHRRPRWRSTSTARPAARRPAAAVLGRPHQHGVATDADRSGAAPPRPNPQEAADQLVDMANAAGGDDNITVVVSTPWTTVPPLGRPPPSRPENGFPTSRPASGSPSTRRTSSTPGSKPRSGRRPRRRRRRRFGPSRPPAPSPGGSAAPCAWLMPVFLILGAGLGALGWYARRTYYVGLSGERVTLYRGVPGGVLGWDPTRGATSRLSAGDLTPAERADLEDGHRFSSRAEATASSSAWRTSGRHDSPVIAEPPPLDGPPRPTTRPPSTLR